MSDPFEQPGQFYRGNLHTHSDRSDGALSPEEVCRRYRDNGYDFIALTDHLIGQYDYPIVDTTAFRTTEFTTLIGAEMHSGAMQNGELWHLLAVGLPFDFTPPDAPHFYAHEGQESAASLAQRARDAGAFVSIVHPQWSGLTMDDARSIESAHAVEIYNHGCQVGCQRADGFCTFDLLLSEGKRLTAIATDDAHFTEPDHFGGWVMVKAEENTPEALLQALKDGHHYTSQGPEFRRIVWQEKEVFVECTAVETVIVQGHGSACVTHHQPSLTSVRLYIDRLSTSGWARVTIVDAAGKCAWSNPFWF